MSNLKKKIIVFSIIVFIFIIVVAAIINIDYLKPRLYSGDRITGTIIIAVNGEKYYPNVETFEYENNGTQRLSYDGTSNFSIPGGKYGSYRIGFELDNKELYRLTKDVLFLSYETDPMLFFQYINTNWWHVTNMELSVEMENHNGEWILNTKVYYQENSEDGTESNYPPTEKTISYSDVIAGNNTIQFGV